mmetsp:Transcript_17692/g.27374  ORF Transcript_17692/g.27374 Transcript_17692/m.27374 type:complete len:137 (-) Transcript_17692:634-1044(-)
MPKLKTKAPAGKKAASVRKTPVKESKTRPLDTDLVERLQSAIKGTPGISERNMFGGVCFMHNGNMLCGVAKEKLVVRVGQDAYTKCLKEKHVTEMDFTGRAMKGMIYVHPKGTSTVADLKKWINQGLKFTSSLKKK